jgi:inosine/xanthosine triphosphate pyrophosphatase family protein
LLIYLEKMASFVFVTGNRHKISEISSIFNGDVSFETRPIDLPEIQGTVLEITREKCRVAAEQVVALSVPSSAIVATENNNHLDRRRSFS